MRQNGGEEFVRDITAKQAVAVLAERRLVPRRIIDPEPDKPAEQKVVVQPLRDLA
jgi:hypothetical protein